MSEMKVAQRRGRYGTVEPVGREDFVREVTEGSKVPLDGDDVRDKDEEEREGNGRLRGTGVVVFLYSDSSAPHLARARLGR